MNSSQSMNSYWNPNQLIGTAGSFLVGLLASSEFQPMPRPAELINHPYVVSGGLGRSTFGLFSVTAQGAPITESEIVFAARHAVKRFADAQVSLEPAIARALSAKLWNLYSR